MRPEDNQALRFLGADIISQGYATASTDTGHTSTGFSSTWANNDYEAIINYAHVGMHRAVTSSKAVIQQHYGRLADKSLFFGCSNGGRQALHEAQRYPHDFDAIVAGAPALDFVGVAAAFVNITQKMFPNPQDLSTALVTLEDRQLLRTKIEATCDAADGVTDGVLQDPRQCNFDPRSLQCSVGQEQDCLTTDKVAAILAVYNGPRSTTEQIHPGFPFGAEATDANGWGSWLTGGLTGGVIQGMPNAAFAFGVGMMRDFVHHDALWDYQSFDWDNYRRDVTPVALAINATNPDLNAFRKQGGKLLLYHGWADMALTAHMSTNYVDQVYANDNSAVDDVRLFMMPGVLHCAGGNGPSMVNWLDELERWHDTGVAPEQVVVAYPDKDGQRMLCAWPQAAVYSSGNPDDFASYHCE